MKPIGYSLVASAFLFACAYVLKANGEAYEQLSVPHSPQGQDLLPAPPNFPPLDGAAELRADGPTEAIETGRGGSSRLGGMVDAPGSKPVAFGRQGSSPWAGTNDLPSLWLPTGANDHGDETWAVVAQNATAPEPQIVTPPIAPRSWYDPTYKPTSRGDVTRISGVAVVTTYHPTDKDGGGWGTAMGTRVREGVAAVKSDYFQRLKGSVIEINGKQFVVEDCGPFYGKNERAVDVARFGLTGFKRNGLDVMRITVIETKNPEAWKAYLKRAEDAARRKGFIKEVK